MKIIIPTNCPTCDSTLELVNSQLFCRNKQCSAQTSKILEGFCKKMKIKGFGEKTLEKLDITSITELYQLTKQDLVQSTSDKVGSKLHEEIEQSKSARFEDFIKSLGVDLIGASAATKIVTVFSSPDDTCSYDILRKGGLGDKAALSFMNYLDSHRGHDEMHMASQLFTFRVESAVDASETSSSSAYPVLEVCITGKLNDYKSRSDVTKALSPYNIVVKSSVTKNVAYLICEDEARKGSSSYKKALDKNIPILTINELLNIVTEK